MGHNGQGEESMDLNSGREGLCSRNCQLEPRHWGTESLSGEPCGGSSLAGGRKAVLSANVSQVTTPCNRSFNDSF